MPKKIGRKSNGLSFKYSENVTLGKSLEKGNIKKIGSKKDYVAMKGKGRR